MNEAQAVRDKIYAKKRKTEKQKEEELAVSSAHVANNEYRMSGQQTVKWQMAVWKLHTDKDKL